MINRSHPGDDSLAEGAVFTEVLSTGGPSSTRDEEIPVCHMFEDEHLTMRGKLNHHVGEIQCEGLCLLQ